MSNTISTNRWFLNKSRLVPTLIMMLIFGMITAQKKADLIITNAKIYTVNQNFDTAEAMAISDGKIVAVGKSADILKNYKAKNVQNLQGKTVFPGLIDAHCHFTGFATDKWKCDSGAPNPGRRSLPEFPNTGKRRRKNGCMAEAGTKTIGR